jgi:hypothetical protein
MPKAQKQPSKRIIPLSVPLSPTCIKPDPDADAATPLPTVKLPSTAAASSSRHVRQDLFSTPGPSSPSLDAAALKPYKCPYTGRCLDEKDGGVVIKSSDGYTFRCQSFDLMSARWVVRIDLPFHQLKNFVWRVSMQPLLPRLP